MPRQRSYIQRNGKVIGPFSPDAVKDRIGTSKIRATDQIGRASDGPWETIGNVQGWAKLFEAQSAADPFDVFSSDAYGDDAYGDDAYGDDAYGDDAYGDDAYGDDASQVSPGKSNKSIVTPEGQERSSSTDEGAASRWVIYTASGAVLCALVIAAVLIYRTESRKSLYASKRLWDTASQHLSHGDVENAKTSLQAYVASWGAVDREKAENLLSQIEFATSDAAITNTLLELSETAFQDAKDDGNIDDGKVIHEVLLPVRAKKVLELIPAVENNRMVAQREEVQRRLDAEREAEDSSRAANKAKQKIVNGVTNATNLLAGKKIKKVKLSAGDATITDDVDGMSHIKVECNNGLTIDADWKRNALNEFGYDIYEPEVNITTEKLSVMILARVVIASYLNGEYD
jgi:hypothetical protein